MDVFSFNWFIIHSEMLKQLFLDSLLQTEVGTLTQWLKLQINLSLSKRCFSRSSDTRKGRSDTTSLCALSPTGMGKGQHRMPTKDELVQRYNRMNTIPQVSNVGKAQEICLEKERDKFSIGVRMSWRQRLKVEHFAPPVEMLADSGWSVSGFVSGLKLLRETIISWWVLIHSLTIGLFPPTNSRVAQSNQGFSRVEIWTV